MFSGLFMSLAATFPARGWAIIFRPTRLSAPEQPNFCRSQRGKNEVARAQEGPDGRGRLLQSREEESCHLGEM